MRTQFHYLVMAFFIGIGSCKDNNIDLPDHDLLGAINGEEWEYSSANAFRLALDGKYNVKFLSSQETASDPCTLPSVGTAHVKAIFVPSVGDFTVSPLAIDANQVEIAFEISPSKTLTASGGFMSIFDIYNNLVIGYLNATLDEDNRVEGNFTVRICN